MKTQIITTAFAGLGLVVLPLHAEEMTNGNPGATTTIAADVAAESIPTYIVHIKGGG